MPNKNDILDRINIVENRRSCVRAGPYQLSKLPTARKMRAWLALDSPNGRVCQIRTDLDAYYGAGETNWQGVGQGLSDAEFILHALDDIPWLCETIRSLLETDPQGNKLVMEVAELPR